MKKMLFLALFFIATNTGFAHSFHYELQILNTLQINEENQLESMRLSWIYDGDVSEAMLQDEKDLEKLGKKVISDLEKLAYFTQVKLNGKVLDFNKATDVKLETKKVKTEDQSYDALQLFFTLPFKTAPDMSGENIITLVHEDPSAAAILYYEDAKTLLASGMFEKKCSVEIVEKKDFEEGEFPQLITINCKI